MSNNDFPDFSAFAVGGDEDGLPDFSDQAVGPKAPDLPIPQKYYDDIKRIEGFSPVAKWDYKQNTNGYGTRALHPGERIDEAEAERRYNREIAKAAASVDSFLPGLPEGVRASLASLTFNSGDKWQRMGLGAALKAGDMEEAGRRFNQYVNADGKPLGGLINRRAEEYQWWRDHQAGDFESKPETDNPDLKALLSASPEKRRELLLNQIENVTGADMSAYRQPKPAAPAPAGPKLDFSDFAVDPGADAPKDNREKPKDKNALPDDQKGVFGDLWGILAPEERVPATKEELASGKSQLEIAKAIKEKTGKALEDFTTDRAKKPESALDWVLRYNPAGLIGDKLTEWGLLGADAAAAARVESQEKRIKGAEDALAGKGPLVSKSGSRAAAEGAIESAATMVPKAIEYYGQLRGYGTQLGQKLRGDEVTAKVEDDAAYKFGKKLEDWLKEKFPGDEARQHQFGQQVAQGVGSTVGFWGPGAITKLLGGGEKAYMAAIALSGIAAQSADVFNEITEKINSGNATEKDRIINWLSGIPLGASEALPFSPTIGGPMAKWLGGRVAGAVEQGVEESLQEGFQGIGGNYAAKKTYDPERNIMEGVPEGMAVGLLTGLGGGAALKNGEVPAQAAPPQRPQVSSPQPNAPRPAPQAPIQRQAPVPAPGGQLTPEDIALLRSRDWSDEAIAEMGPDEIQAELDDARAQSGSQPAQRPADQPSAEPVSDIEAQIASLRAGERKGVYLSAANVENLQSQPEFVNRIAEALNSVDGAKLVQNVDGKGGIMVAANADVARNIDKAVKSGVDVQTVLGEATGAGTGKPADATAVVQQKTPEGAVTRESLVTSNQVAKTEQEFAQPGKTVETVTPEQAIARREEKIAEEKQTGPMVSRVPTFQDIAEELPKDEDGLPNYQALSDRIKEIGKKGWPDLNVMEKAKLYREFAGQGTGTRAAPVAVETADDLALVSHEADSEYTPAQGEANNRKLGHAKWNGLDLSIETKAGGVRKGIDKETGKTWETTMGAAYGYIRGTTDNDDMHVDVFVGPDVSSERVFVIDEVDNRTGEFRQHKTFVGFPDEESAIEAYTGTSSKTPDMIGAVTEMSADAFRDWVLDGKKTEPLGSIEKPDFSSRAVEPEAPAKPAETKSETIAPPARYEGEPLSEMEIDALVDSWKYVQEVSRRPRPQSLSSYVIDNGGLRDDAREVRHIAGSAKERPGLVNSKGQTLDDAALSAWEAGFFTGDRPEIAEFLDALQDDLHTGEVVREEDLLSLEDFRIAEDIAQELADYGVTTNRFRSEASLREYFGQERPRTTRETEAAEETQTPAKERPSRTGDVEEAPFDLPAKGEEKKPFDPYAFSVQAVYAKQGEEALKKRLAEFGVDELKQIVSAQNLGVKSDILDGSNAIALRKAIVDAAREKLANRMAAAGGTVEGALKKPGNAGVQEKPYELANDAKAFEAYVKGEQAAPEPTTNEKTADLANLPDGYSVELSSTRLKGDEARIKGGEYKAIARRQQPAGSPSVVDGYGNTPEEAMRNALRKVGYQPSVVTEKSGQTSLVPEPTTKEKIAAEAKTKEKKGGNEPMDEGLFGSSKDQLDLVDMAKQREKEPENERTASQDQEKQTGDTPDSEAYETLADLQKAVADGKVKSHPDREHLCYKYAGQKALDGGYDLVLGKVGDKKIRHGVARTLDEKYIYDPQYDVWMAADVYDEAVGGFEEEFVLSSADVQTFLDDFNVWPSMAMLEKHGWLGGEAIEESAPATSVEEPVETSETEQESEETETKPQEAVSLQDALRDRLLGEGFATIIEARKFAKEHGFEGSTKDVDEIVEQAVVAAARQVASETGDAKSAYQALVDLYNNQPNLAVRTSTSVTNQAYSTPAPLAYLASRLAGVANASHVLEPTAGNGMLLIEADPNTVEANEIDPKRAQALRDQNFATVKSVDATEPSLARAKSADSVIMNPPFGAVREDGQSKSWTVDGLQTSAIDHAIALNALHAMTDDGKAVIIMGGVNAESIEERRKGYRGQAKRLFFAKLYKTYNVTDHFTVSGDLYKKQGAGWPVDVVVISGRGQSERPLPAAEPPVILKTWDDLKGKLPDVGTSTKPIRGSQQATDADNRPAGGTDLGKRGSESGDVSGRPNAGTSGTERLPAGTKDKPADLRADRDRGQPYDVSKGVGNEPDTAAQSVRDRRAANERPASSRKPRVERTAPPEGSGQALYEPASAAQSLDTLIPVNMAQATKSALSRVEARHGSLDAFVADRLGYTDDLSKYFSAEQVDAIATAIDNIERGSGYILGDQCVGGETLILDPATGDHTPIQVLTERGQPISVLSLTNDGFARRPATAPFLKGVADLYRVTFDDESSITVTRGHRFLTSNGWASLDAGVEVGTEIVASLPADLQNYTSHRRVVAIQFDRHDAFFDMHVPGTFNYVANGVVNHNTGIGKGRVVAATIRYAIRKGWTPVFVTEKPDLYGDMFRDMNDIGLHKMLGHEPRALMTNTGESVPLDEEALAWKQEADQARADGQPIPKRRGRFLTAGGKPAQEKAMQAMASGKGQHDIVFTTYDQMNTIKKQETDRRRFLRQIMPNSLLILDESHNAGGQGEKLFKAKHGDAPDRAEYVRGLVKGAAGVVYSSATFAKRPDVMDLYARTDMGKAVDDPKMLPALIQKGGVPMQQIVASMLSNAGQYMRRERSFEGVEYAVEPVPVDEKTYKQFSDAVRAVFEFDLAVEDIRDEVMEDILDQMGATKAKDAGVGGGSASSIAFASIMHNIVNQMLLSIKARQVAQRAIDAHKAGEKPVIALAGTMESFISDYAEDAGISIGQPIAISFGDVLQRYLSRTLRITVKDSDNQKKHVQIPISDLPPSLQRKYAEAEQLIKEGDFDSMPVSPIDAIRHELTSAGLSVAEVTGRKVMIDYGAKGNSAVLIDRPKSEIGPSGKRSSIAAFNRGGLDALILNRSGSTGVSMHASKAFKDQSPRRMIIAQAEANIDTHLQMLGRVHRTGQVIPPSYSQIAAEIPAEARPTAVLMKKMASLNANTTGARGSVFMADSIDFMNEYGDKVVANIIQDEPEINAKLGNPLKENDKGLPVSEDAARRVTGRLVLLTPKEQTELLNRIQDEYKAEIERLDALGENALEAKTVDLKARHIETTALKDRTGEGPFLDSAQIEKVSIKSQGRAMAPKEVAEKISEALEITTPEGEGAAQLAVLERSGREWMNKKIGDVRSRSQSWIASDVASKSDDAKVTTKKRHDDQLARWIQTAQVVAPGARVTLQLGDRQMHAIVLSVARTGKAKNPVALGAWTATMAVPDSVRTLTLPFSQLFPPSQVKGSEESGAEVRFSQVPFTGLISQLEDARREGREDRYIVTGNILAGYDQVHGKGQIVNFTMEDGTLRPGILMSRDFQLNKFMSARTVRFKTAAQVAAFLEKAPMAEVQTSDKYVTFSRPRGEYVIETAAGRATGGQYYTDTRVRDALQGREFVRSGGIMRVTMPDRSAFTRVLDAIRKVGGIFETTSDQDLAQEIIRQTSPLSALGGDHDPQAINNIERRLVVGREARIAPSAVQFALEAIKNDLKLAPANTIVAAVSKIATDAEHDGHVLITATKHDGKTVTARLPWDRVKDSRAIFIPGRRPTILHINFRTPPESARRVQEVGQVTGRGALDEVAEMRFALAESIRADFIHELTHLLRTTGVLTGSRWQRLLDHANSLQLLELDVNAPVSERIMLRELGVEPKQTLRDAYSGIYAHYSNAQEAVDQEAVAALREMAWLGLLSDEQLAPVRDILDEISDGNIRGLGFNESGGPAYAIGGRDIFDEIEDTIYAGKTYVIPYGRVVTQMEDARPHLNMVPKGTIVGVLERITPVGNSIDPLNQQVELRFMLPNGKFVTITHFWTSIADKRALTQRFGDRSGLFFLNPRGFLDSGKTLSGEIWHEVTHILRVPPLVASKVAKVDVGLVGDRWSRLLAHANKLQILDRVTADVLKIVGVKNAGGMSTTRTLRQDYSTAYHNRSDKVEIIRQESVAHMLELWHHGAISDEDMAPVMDIIEDIRSGRLAGNPAFESSSDPTYAIGKSQSDQDSLGYYSKLLRAAYNLKQEKGTPEQMLAQLRQQADVKAAEIEATGLDKFLSSPPVPDQAFWNAAKPMDAELEGESGLAVDAWVGGPHNTIELGLPGGLMIPSRLENMSAAALDAMAAPVRAALRQRYGDEITVYRGEREGGTQSDGRVNKLVSYTTDRDVARSFSGARKKARKVYSEADIVAAEKALKETGEAQIAGTTFRQDPESQWVDMYDMAGDFITDTESIRWFVEQRNAEAKEANDERAAAMRGIREVRIPVESVIWATDRFNQKEIVARAGMEQPVKSIVTKTEIINYLSENRVELQEKVYLTPKWANLSVDPNNPTYQETVLHLPSNTDQGVEIPNTAGGWGNIDLNGETMRNPEYDRVNFTSGHWSEPNVVAHTRTQILTDANGHKVFNIDELQSDWGQAVRDRETKTPPISHPLVNTTDQWTTTAVRRLVKQAVESGADAISFTPGRVQAARFNLAKNVRSLEYDPTKKSLYIEPTSGNPFERDVKWLRSPKDLEQYVGKEAAKMLLAEPLGTNGAKPTAHKIVFKEGQVVGGDGMKATYDVMYPRLLGKLLAKMDPSIKAEKTNLFKHDGNPVRAPLPVKEVVAMGLSSPPAEDFTAFPITDKVRSQVLNDGQPLFAISGRPKNEDPVVGYLRWAQDLKPATLSITDKVGRSYRFERQPVGNGAIYYRAFDGSKQIASFYVRTGGSVFDSISVMNAMVEKPYRRLGIASAAYDAIEADTAPGGLPLYPQGTLSMSQDAKAFWETRNPERLREMERAELDRYSWSAAQLYQSKIDNTAKANVETAIKDALEIVGRIAGRNINVDLKPTIPVGAALDASSRADLEASGQDLPETAGGYYKTVRNGTTGVVEGPHVIGLAFDDPRFDLRTTAGHEAWHHVETVLSTPQEMRLLQSPAEMARMTRLAAKEAGRSTAETSRLPAYEIRALAFQNYRRMREEGAAELSGLHIGVRRFFERIAKTLAAIRNALKGMGYASFEDIFERARTGETAAKAEQQEAETKEQQLEQAVKSAMQSSSNNNPDPAATINAFIDQRMARDDGSAASQVQAYHAYSLWADEAGLELPTIEEFDKAMRRQGVRRMMLAGDVRYVGLRVVEEAEEKPANPSAKIEKDAFQIAKELALGMSIEGAIEKQIEKVKSVIGEKPDFARLALLQTLKANDNANEKIHENIISMGNVMPSNPLRGTLHRRALRMLARVANISDAARVRIQDKALPIRRLAVERVENETGAAVPVSLDTYISEGLYHGRAGERLNDLKEDRIEPLLEHMRASGLTLDAVGDYLYARHAFERNDAIRQIDPNNDAGSGMTDEEAQATLDRVYQSGKQADMDTAVRMVDTIIDDARNTLLRSGLIDRTTYDKWREKYPNYVPLRGFDLGEDENPDRPRAGRGFDLRGAESKQALGRRSKSDNPLVYTIMQAEEAIIRAEKNRVAKTLYRMIQANPNPAVWELYRGEAKRRVNPSTGLVETYWVRPPFVHNDAVHGVKFNGKQFWMELKHPALARAMRGVGSEWNGSIIGRAMMTLTRTYASLLTSYNPEFVVSNFFRDLETSLMNVSDVANKPAGLRRQILKDATSLKSIRGALAAVRDHEGRTIFGTHRRADENILGLPKSAAAQEYARWYDEFRLAGGKISFMEFNDVERIKHRINADLKAGRMKRALRGAAEYVENLNTAVENGVRLSTYVALRRAGVEQDRAAFTARELTVNFNRRGEWGPAINSMYLFFNASVQGSTRVAQAFVRSKAVRYGVASIFAAGMALDLFNFLAAGDGDDGENKYDAIPDWIKERNVIIMNPFGDDYIMIPMAYGYNVPYVAGLKATEMVRGKTSPLQAAASVTGQVVDSFNPMGTAERFYQLVSPTIIDPAVQVLENKTWYGGPIYPTKYDKRKPESENYFTSAPWWAIDMAKTLNSVTGGNHRRSGWFDVSPEVIEHYAEFAGGGVAKFIGNAMNSGERLVNGDEWLPEKTPLLRRVYGKPTSEGRKRDFYELWDDADRARYESQSDDKEVAEAAREKYAPELRIYGAAKGAKNALKALRAQRDKIMADDKLDHAERQAKLNDILEREKALISRVLKLYRDAKAQQSEKETTP